MIPATELKNAGSKHDVQPDALSTKDVEDFARAITLRLGHLQDISRQQDLATILRRRMQQTGCSLYRDYRPLLQQAAEWEALDPLLTVPETYFFRMPSHFEALAQDVVPQVMDANRGSRSLRILSAGCATGEEPYTLRILLNERFPELADWNISIVGADLSLSALELARTGVYTEWSLRATSAARRIANFSVEGKHFRLKPSARAGVVFRRENLLTPVPPEEPKFDIIFCRNVLIYFTDAAIRATIERLTERLRPAGFLFLGPAESLRGMTADFHLCQGHDVVYYRLRAAAERKTPLSLVAQTASSQAPSQVVSGALRADPAAESSGGGWYSSIEQSWQRLAVLMPGPDKDAPRPRLPAQDRALPEVDSEGAFVALVAAERFGQALDLLETMASPASNISAAGRSLLRAAMLTNLGRYEEAERACKLLLAADPTHAGAHFLLGLGREQAGALQEAADYMATSTYLDPTFPMAHLHLGLIWRRQHNEVAARTSFRHALDAIEHEDAKRLALFGGGFSRESLQQLCRRELDGLHRNSSQHAPGTRPEALAGRRHGA